MKLISYVLLVILLCPLPLVHAQTTSRLVYSTYLGGIGSDVIRDIAVDSQGNVYVTGGTASSGLATSGTFDTSFNGNVDAFAAKFNSSGQRLWFTYLGGPNYDRAYAIRLDNLGNVYVAGRCGNGYPTTPGAFQTTFKGDNKVETAYGAQDAFLTKLSPDGQVIYSTYVGESGKSVARSLDVNAAGEAALVLINIQQPAPGLITPNAWDTTFDTGNISGRGAIDGILVKINAQGSGLIFGTYIGANGYDMATPSVRYRPDGSICVLSDGDSTNLPTSSNAFQRTNGGRFDMWLGIFSGTGSYIASTYFGGSQTEFIETHTLAIAPDGSVYIAGTTLSLNLPAVAGRYQSRYGGTGGSGTGANTNYSGDGFVAKISPDCSTAIATYLGGSFGEGLQGIDVDSSGRPCVSGMTYSSNFPTTADKVQNYVGAGDGFVSCLSPDLMRLEFSMTIGGSAMDQIRCLDVQGNFIYAAGHTLSTNFLTTSNAYQRQRGGADDGVWFKISLNQVAPTPLPNLSSLSVAPTTILGGQAANGTITISLPAPTGGVGIGLSSSNPAVSVPSNVTIPSGQTSITFPITSTIVPTDTGITITASGSGLTSKTATLTLTSPPAPVADIESISFTPLTVIGGSAGIVGVVKLTQPGPVTVNLASSNTAAATVPNSITIPSGANSATFTVSTLAVSVDAAVTITASGANLTPRQVSLTVIPGVVTPPPIPQPNIDSLTLAASSIQGGNNVAGQVRLTLAPGGGGQSINLSSNHVAAILPSTITIPEGQLTASFNVSTVAVTGITIATLSASGPGLTSKSINLSITPPPAPPQPDVGVFYVSPTGTAGGNGSINQPWDLQTALNHPASVKPGDTIYLRGGIYRGAFTGRLVGTAAARITVRSYPGEWAKIDGNNGLTTLAETISGQSIVIKLVDGIDFPEGVEVTINNEVILLRGKSGNTYSNCRRLRSGGDISSAGFSHPQGSAVIRRKSRILNIAGAYTDYRDFEILNSLGSPYRVSKFVTGTDKSGWQGTRGDGVGITGGPDNRVINVVIHDAGNGVFFTTNSKEVTIYGTMVFNNGTNGNLQGDREPCRNHGQSLYLQGASEAKLLKHNVIFSSYAGAKIYTVSNHLKNFTLDGNVFFNAGIPACRIMNNVTNGYNNLETTTGDPTFHIENLVIKNNTLYHLPNIVVRNLWLGGAGHVNGTVTTNRILGSHQGMESSAWNGFVFTNNVVSITDDGPVQSTPLTVMINKGASSPAYTWNNNSYFNASLYSKPFRYNGVDYTFPDFQRVSNLDSNSTYAATNISGLHVQVIKNEFESGRGTVIVENYGLLSSVSVDLSSLGLQAGDIFRIYKAEGWPSVWQEYTYNGQAISIDMSNTFVTQPIGVAAGTVPSTLPRFGVFIVKRCPCVW